MQIKICLIKICILKFIKIEYKKNYQFQEQLKTAET